MDDLISQRFNNFYKFTFFKYSIRFFIYCEFFS